MSRFELRRSRQPQRGMSLVELMVAMVLGLLFVIAVAYFFLGGRQVNRTHDDLSRIQENGRYALEYLGKAIRQAGARTDVSLPFPATALTGTDGTCAGASCDPDTITVRYDVQDGGETDCTGATVATGPVTYVFAVDPATRTLTCNGVAVADNVENMQVSYGIDSLGNGDVTSYRTASAVANFAQVAAVRVSLLIRGATPNIATNHQTYTYDGNVVTAGDTFLRQVYASTFTVRNQAR
jgi:type IV pilus assembly protein PilW